MGAQAPSPFTLYCICKTEETVLWAKKGLVELQSSLYLEKWEEYVPSGPETSVITMFKIIGMLLGLQILHLPNFLEVLCSLKKLQV